MGPTNVSALSCRSANVNVSSLTPLVVLFYSGEVVKQNRRIEGLTLLILILISASFARTARALFPELQNSSLRTPHTFSTAATDPSASNDSLAPPAALACLGR